mgnify:CR=1 FL=1
MYSSNQSILTVADNLIKLYGKQALDVDLNIQISNKNIMKNNEHANLTNDDIKIHGIVGANISLNDAKTEANVIYKLTTLNGADAALLPNNDAGATGIQTGNGIGTIEITWPTPTIWPASTGCQVEGLPLADDLRGTWTDAGCCL